MCTDQGRKQTVRVFFTAALPVMNLTGDYGGSVWCRYFVGIDKVPSLMLFPGSTVGNQVGVCSRHIIKLEQLDLDDVMGS